MQDREDIVSRATAGRCCPDVHQIIERVARGLLAHEGIPFGTSHNLGQMAEALPTDHPFRERVRDFDDLSTAMTAYRYPTDAGRLKKAPPTDVLEMKLVAAEQLLREAAAYVHRSEEAPRKKP